MGDLDRRYCNPDITSWRQDNVEGKRINATT